MSVESPTVKLGTAARAIELLKVDDQQLQRVIDNPLHRSRVKAAFWGQYPIVQEMNRDHWIARESAILVRLLELGLRFTDSHQQIGVAWQEGFTAHHRYVPAGLTRRDLLVAFGNIDAKLLKRSLKDACHDYGQELLTEAGVFDYDLMMIGRPVDAQHRPFRLSDDEQEAWCRSQGGDGLASVEEVLYLMLRGRIELGYIPVVGLWVGGRNYSGRSSGRLGVCFDTCYGGLFVATKDSGNGHNWSCVPRRFNR